jgi:hypothetical protein
LQLLFISSDHDQSSFEEYFAEMTFGALPFEERQAKADIATKLGVRGIPTLMIFGPRPANGGDRPLINEHLRGIVEHGDYLSEYPFCPKPFGDLNKATDNINNFKSIIIFHEGGDDDEQHDIEEALQQAAENYEGEDKVKFYWATMPSRLSKTVRDALQLGPISNEPMMVLLDIPNNASFYVSKETDVSMESILGFLHSPGERRHL